MQDTAAAGRLPGSELRLGTRGSQLALWQARAVASRIADTGGPPCLLVVIKTSGDRLQEAPLSTSGGKRLFVKEIEDALARGDVDLAVHSSKDMPAALPDGLVIGAVLPREDPRDALVLPALRAAAVPPDATLEQIVGALGRFPSFGTGSIRRIAQLCQLFPGARFTPVRGNLDTRLARLDRDNGHQALVLAAAGLRRLGLGARISFALPPEACVPAPGQGLVAVEIRQDDAGTREIVGRIDDPLASAALAAERALVEALGGGCQTPIGALATPAERDDLDLTAIVAAPDGSRALRAHARGLRREAAALGADAAAQLLAGGAETILADARRSSGVGDGSHPSGG